MDKKTKDIIQTIEGKLHPTEPPILYEFGKRCTGRGVIVEIGSFKGLSTILLARGSLHNSKTKVFGVDTFDSRGVTQTKGENTFFDFKRNIKSAGLEDLVVPLKGLSVEVAKKFNKPIEILFIDGSHDYKSVLEDINHWAFKIIRGGWIIFHDTDFDSVMRAFKQKILASKEYSNIGFCGSIIYAQKIPSSQFGEIKKRLVLSYRKILVTLWKYIPEELKKKIRSILGKQYDIKS